MTGHDINCGMEPERRYMAVALVLMATLTFLGEPPAKETVVEGVVDYTGTPQTDLLPIHGYEYYLVTDSNVRVRLWEEGFVEKGHQILQPNLEGERVRVTGVLVEDYSEYARRRGRVSVITSADPEGRVLTVSKAEVMQSARVVTASQESPGNSVVLYLHVMG